METEIFSARVRDTAEICERTSKPKFFGFLSEAEAAAAAAILKRINCKSDFFGGYEGALRVMLGCFPDWCDNFDYPITPLTLSYRKTDKPSHRDFLGALMALGIKRETVGDILVGEGKTVIFVTDEICKFVTEQLNKVGGTGVTVQKGYTLPLPEYDKTEDFTVTAASERLDCIVSALCDISRSNAKEKIENGLVSVNSCVCEKITKSVFEGDVLSVRGKGRFIVGSLSGRTRKDRIIVGYKKYVR